MDNVQMVTLMIPAFLADAGTPVLWAGTIHLLIGNLIIGLIEVGIVRWLFAAQGGTRMRSMIITGNYVSCVAGLFLSALCPDWVIQWAGGPLPVYSLSRIMMLLLAMSFVVTILVEWPFYFFVQELRRQRNTFKATLVANAASYAVLIAWYWLASATPLQWGVNLVAAREMTLIPGARIFYISPNGNDVMQIRLDGSAATQYCKLPSTAIDGVLGFTSEPINGSWELQVKPDWDHPPQHAGSLGPGRAATRPTEGNLWHRSTNADNLDPSGKWSVSLNPWDVTGISVSNKQNGETWQIMGVEMPWVGWRAENATLLPDDQMVFQLGEQIMRVDLRRKQAAAIAAGHGPVVVMDK